MRWIAHLPACSAAVALACAGAERSTPAADSALAGTPTLVRLGDTVVRRPSAGDSATPAATPAKSPASTAQLDSASGVVRLVGPDPVSRLALFPVGSVDSAPLALDGAQLSELSAAVGLEVMIRGTRSTDRAMDVAPGGAIVFHVRHFEVRTVDGVEAHDGILIDMAGRMILETASGTRTVIVNLPSALRTKRGARVFLVGPLTRAPQAFGVLREP